MQSGGLVGGRNEEDRMIIKHRGKSPKIHDSAYIAPNATISGDVTIGENSRVLFGAVITSEGGPVVIGSNCVIMETAVIRGTKKHPTKLGNNVLVGPRAYLTGCTIEDSCFLATGSTIFNGAHVGEGSTIRINGLLHIKGRLAPGSLIPINWVAVGDPAVIRPPNEHDEIWAVQEKLNFPMEVFGLEREAGINLTRKMTDLYCKGLTKHLEDQIIE